MQCVMGSNPTQGQVRVCFFEAYLGVLFIRISCIHCVYMTLYMFVNTRKVFKAAVSYLERDLNPQSPAYLAGALTTKPLRQLSSLGTTK